MGNFELHAFENGCPYSTRLLKLLSHIIKPHLYSRGDQSFPKDSGMKTLPQVVYHDDRLRSGYVIADCETFFELVGLVHRGADTKAFRSTLWKGATMPMELVERIRNDLILLCQGLKV